MVHCALRDQPFQSNYKQNITKWRKFVLFMLKGNYIKFWVYLGEVKPLMALGEEWWILCCLSSFFPPTEHNLKSIPKLTWLRTLHEPISYNQHTLGQGSQTQIDRWAILYRKKIRGPQSNGKSLIKTYSFVSLWYDRGPHKYIWRAACLKPLL
jgi:hypothetical protein